MTRISFTGNSLNMFCLFEFASKYKQIFKLMLFMFFYTIFDFAQSKAENLIYSQNIRKTAVVGMFYPAESSKLEEVVNNLLTKAQPSYIASSTCKIVGLIAPHAGYVYSGQTAAIAFKAIYNQKFDTIYFLGVDHTIGLPEISIWKDGGYETPLGTIYVDATSTNQLIQKFPDLITNPIQHLQEHSIEVLLPFYIKAVGNYPANFIIVGHNLQKAIKLGEILYEIISQSKGRTLIVASSDWSHYYDAEMAYKMDYLGIQNVLNLDIENLIKNVEKHKTELCGFFGVVTLLTVMKKAQAKVTLLDRTDSSLASGDKSKVVGYAAILFESTDSSKNTTNTSPNLQGKESQNNSIQQGGNKYMNNLENQHCGNNKADSNKNFQIEALKAVRKVLESYLKDKTIPNINFLDPKFEEERGVFVTLKKHGELRGCIGTIIPTQSLKEGLKEMAIAAATRDPRFYPVTYDELKDIEIEISILSPLIPVNDISEIVVGRDGLVLKKGFYSGVLLPQVPVEYGWDKDTYLRHLCLKAGLPPGSHLSPDAKLFRFTAEVFSEHELGLPVK